MEQALKRLIFCFDGSWNKISEHGLTNVALTASAVAKQQVVQVDDEDLLKRGFSVGDIIPQIVHYDEGVGTNRNEKYGGGMFGKGLYANVREAYLFLCLNYEPGDEIYLFGFSRGAYTARSFGGLVGNCGIMRSEYIEKVLEAARLYKARGEANTDAKRIALQEDLFALIKKYGHPVTTCQAEHDWKLCQFGLEEHNHPRVDIKYIGLWDTVKSIFTLRQSLGLPDPSSEFHDEDIPECTSSGRHAVALDEHRKTFDFTPWENLDQANKRVFEKINWSGSFDEYKTSKDRAFKEVWFPGTHGSVGGGGERRGLSDTSLLWVLDGARAEGLQINTVSESKVFQLKPTPIHYLDNTEKDGVMEQVSEIKSAVPFLKFTRSGPNHLSEVSGSALARYAAPPSVLPKEEERKSESSYRPGALKKIENEVKAFVESHYTEEDFELYNGYADSDWEKMEAKRTVSGWEYELYTVKQDDTLSKIAKSEIQNNSYKALQACNKVMVPNYNMLHPGQVLSIPKRKV